MLASNSPTSRDTSVGKALSVLDAFPADSSLLGVSEIADRTGMAKSTTHRLLTSLVAHGYVAKKSDRYQLSEHLFELGQRAQVGETQGLRSIAAPYMAELFAATRQTVHLGVLSGTDVLYVDKIGGRGVQRMHTQVGGRRPAHSTGLGKALIAFGNDTEVRRNLQAKFHRFTSYTIADFRGLKQSIIRVRDNGIATDHEESFLGITCLAVPIFDKDSKSTFAALSISGTVSGPPLLHFRSSLSQTANLISIALNSNSSPP